jgi:hypothetical protein
MRTPVRDLGGADGLRLVRDIQVQGSEVRFPASRRPPTREVLMARGGEGTWHVARTLAWVVLAVMAVALAYTGWIAITNFHRIGV